MNDAMESPYLWKASRLVGWVLVGGLIAGSIGIIITNLEFNNIGTFNDVLPCPTTSSAIKANVWIKGLQLYY